MAQILFILAVLPLSPAQQLSDMLLLGIFYLFLDLFFIFFRKMHTIGPTLAPTELFKTSQQ